MDADIGFLIKLFINILCNKILYYTTNLHPKLYLAVHVLIDGFGLLCKKQSNNASPYIPILIIVIN